MEGRFRLKSAEDAKSMKKDLVKLMNPRYLEVKGIFMPRGGISILPFANYADEEHEEMRKARLLANFTENF